MSKLIDFITLCNVGINVLDSRTYGTADETEDDCCLMELYDCNTISDDDRRKYVHERGLSLELLHWVGTRYFVFDNDRNKAHEIQDMQEQHMTWLGQYMLQYLEDLIKDESKKEDPQLPFPDPNSLQKQLDWAIYTVPWSATERTEDNIFFLYMWSILLQSSLFNVL